MLTIKEQVAGIIKDALGGDELEAYLAMQSGSWEAYDIVSDEQAEAGVTDLCEDIVTTILREFVILEREDDDE